MGRVVNLNDFREHPEPMRSGKTDWPRVAAFAGIAAICVLWVLALCHAASAII